MGNRCGKITIKTAEDFENELQLLDEALARQEKKLIEEEEKAERLLSQAVDNGYEQTVCQDLSDKFVKVKDARVLVTVRRDIISEALEKATTKKERSEYRERIVKFNESKSTKKKKYYHLDDMKLHTPQFD